MGSSRHWASIEKIRVRITTKLLSRQSEGAFLIVFEGAVDRAGTSTMAVALSSAFHDSMIDGKVLVLGLNPVGRSVESIARVVREQARPQFDKTGPAEHDADALGGDLVRSPADDATAQLLGSVKQARSGYDVLSITESSEMRGIFQRESPFWPIVSKIYKIVCIDGGLVGSEAHILAAKKAELSLLVVDGKRTTRTDLTRMRKRMNDAEILPDGVILNKRQDYLPRLFRAAVE